MKRFHVHLNVDQLDSSIRFYTLFGVKPSVLKSDYAKWMLDDQRINFAISQGGRAEGVDHLGMQVEDESAPADIGERLHAADTLALAWEPVDKFWAEDPQGIRGESVRTLGEATTYTDAVEASAAVAATSCYGPIPSSSCC